MIEKEFTPLFTMKGKFGEACEIRPIFPLNGSESPKIGTFKSLDEKFSKLFLEEIFI